MPWYDVGPILNATPVGRKNILITIVQAILAASILITAIQCFFILLGLSLHSHHEVAACYIMVYEPCTCILYEHIGLSLLRSSFSLSPWNVNETPITTKDNIHHRPFSTRASHQNVSHFLMRQFNPACEVCTFMPGCYAVSIFHHPPTW